MDRPRQITPVHGSVVFLESAYEGLESETGFRPKYPGLGTVNLSRMFGHSFGATARTAHDNLRIAPDSGSDSRNRRCFARKQARWQCLGTLERALRAILKASGKSSR
jgi:hypothetical protein